MQREIQHSAQASATAKGIAIGCYLTAAAGLIALLGLMAALGLDLAWWPAQAAGAWTWLANLGLVVLFGLQHSGMARTGFKRLWTRVVPEYLEPAIYSGMSGAVLLALCLWWQPLGGEELWHLPRGFAAVALLGGLGMTFIVLRFDDLGLFGMRQVLQAKGSLADQLRRVGPYRWVRHPLMSCALVLLWGWPVMPPTLALLSGGLSAYILLARPLEEATLMARFGDSYRDYRRRVPAYFPWRRPAPAAVAEESAS